MPRELLHGLAEVIIHLINALLLFILRRAGHNTLFHGRITHVEAMLRLVGDGLGNDVLRALKSLLRVLHLLLLRHVAARYVLLRLLGQGRGGILRQNIFSKAIQALLLCHACPGLSLRAIWSVQVVHQDHGLRRLDLLFQLRRQLSLLLDGTENLFLLLFQVSQIGQSLMKVTKLLIIERSRDLLAVTRNEGDRVPLVDQLYGCFHLPFLNL